MQKPYGLSRRDYRNMKAIILDYLKENVHVWFSGNTAGGCHTQRDEEGYNRISVNVITNGNGLYEVFVENTYRDCDGPGSSSAEYVVTYRRKSKRFYPNKAMRKVHNLSPGGFMMQTHWRKVSEGKSHQRDYRAEASGY